MNKTCNCDGINLACPICTELGKLKTPPRPYVPVTPDVCTCTIDGILCPVCVEFNKVHPIHKPTSPESKKVCTCAYEEGAGLECACPIHWKEQEQAKSKIILKAQINKALSNIEKIPYYNCPDPCGLVRKFGIDWCECDRHERPHPALSPGCPDYTQNLLACWRVAKAARIEVWFCGDTILIRRRNKDNEQGWEFKHNPNPDSPAGVLSLLLYEMIKEGNG